MGQSGGPTAVINASLAGVVAQAQASGAFSRVLGMRHGVQGALEGQWSDLSGLTPDALDRLAHTPSSALGSCRYRLKPGDAQRLVDLCRREAVDTLIYIGGNDSADTARQVARAAEAAGWPLRVIGVPKTIDNDLPATDHCPGYGSAARFVAQTTRETALDTAAMRLTDPVRLVEVMGRHAGWLPAAAWLAKQAPDDAPHLVLVPERPMAPDQVVEAVRATVDRLGWCVLVLCENQPDAAGRVLGAQGEPRWQDAFGHVYFDSPAQFLAQRIQQALGLRARFDKPGTIQRMATGYVSRVDRAEAELVGRAAVREALAGRSGVMVTLERAPGAAYAVSTGTVDLSVVANAQRRLPDAFINPAGDGLTDAFVTYARPLLGDLLPTFQRL